MVEGAEVFLREGGRGRQAGLEVRDIGKGPAELILRALLQDAVGLFGKFRPMTDHEEVVAGSESQADHFVESEMVDDGSHVEVVGHDQSAESHFLT